jgi:hypothetical protein
VDVKGPAAPYVYLYAIYKRWRYPVLPSQDMDIRLTLAGQGEKRSSGLLAESKQVAGSQKRRGAQIVDQHFEPWSNRG